MLCDFLFRPAAILDAPGGPVLIRVPACSRAVPEGCVAMQFQSESGRAESRGGGRSRIEVWGQQRRERRFNPRWKEVDLNF